MESALSPIKSIVTTFTQVGFHEYPDAPEEVAFLRGRHRHLFKIKVFCRVVHANRDLEFFIVQRQIRQWMASNYPQNNETNTVELLFGPRSCEMIASDIFHRFNNTELRMYRVEVWEDDENGGIVEQ